MHTKPGAAAESVRSLSEIRRLSGVLTTQSAAGLTVEVAESLDELRALKPDYDRLQAATRNRLPFALHEWHVAWCNLFFELGKHIHTQPMIHVVRNSERQCVAIVPLILTRRAVGPVKLSSLDMLGADPSITEIRTPLIDPDYEARAAWLVQRKLSGLRSIDWVNWGSISDTYGGALAAGAGLKYQEPLLDYILDLPPSWELLRANLKRNIRESIRHCYNSLRREGFQPELRIAREPGEVKDALEEFFALHAMRAEMQGTVAHPNHFARDRPRRFLREVCGPLAGRDMVRVFQLTIRGEVVATRIGFLIGDSLYLYYSGFDPRFAKYAVMTTTMVEIVKYAIAQRLATINLSPGTDISKTRWGPREIPLSQVIQVTPSLRSRLAWAGYQRAKAATPLPGWIGKISRLGARDWN
jgi:CelD/BcsL family acetyltransferase involved in cellulose biosynthesis